MDLETQLLLHLVADRFFVGSAVVTVQFLMCQFAKKRTQASTVAPLSTLGSASMLSTESKIFSMDCTGDQRSAEDSYTV